jgi:hypothetical protein
MRLVRQPTLKTFLLLLVVFALVLAPLPEFVDRNDVKDQVTPSLMHELYGDSLIIVAPLVNLLLAMIPLILALFIRSRLRFGLSCFTVSSLVVSAGWLSVYFFFDLWAHLGTWFLRAICLSWIPYESAHPPIRYFCGTSSQDTKIILASILLLTALPLLGLLFAKTCKLREVAAPCEPVVDPAC